MTLSFTFLLENGGASYKCEGNISRKIWGLCLYSLCFGLCGQMEHRWTGSQMDSSITNMAPYKEGRIKNY